MSEASRSLQDLTEDECRSLLGSHHFGRLAVVADDRPIVLPVNYVFDGTRIAIRTGPGTKLTAASLGRVAFEIDHVDEEHRLGWSVLVQGSGHDITDAVDEVSEAMRGLPVDPWAPGAHTSWLRIDPTSITGRRVTAG